MRKIYFFTLFLFGNITSTFAQDIAEQESMKMGDIIDSWFQPIVAKLELVFFADLFDLVGLDLGVSLPFIVVWLVFGAVFFTIKINLLNF